MSENLPKIEFNHPRAILCEGEGDRSFFRHLITKRGLPPFDIFCPGKPHTEDGGVEGYDDMLTIFPTGKGFENVRGILIQGDNDDDPDERFGKIRAKIEAAEGYIPPERPLAGIKQRSHLSLVVVMLPWVEELGALETLCLKSAEDKHPSVKECVDAHIRCIDISKWDLVKQHKMRLRCMMASICKTDPYTSLVHAWSRSVEMIPLGHACFDRISDFLEHFDNFINHL